MSMNSENRNAEGSYEACTQFEAMLEDQLQGTLRGPEAAILTEHLASCAGCRTALEDAAVSARLLAIAEPARRSRRGLQPYRDGAHPPGAAFERKQIHLAPGGFGGLALCGYGGFRAGAAGVV